MRIGIDARFYGPSGKGLGRYTEKLVKNLERLDTVNRYYILLRRDNWDAYTPTNQNFTKVLADYRWYSVSEQFGMPRTCFALKLDVMHFTHFNVPLFYTGKFIVTIHDLILTRYPTQRATTLGPLLYTLKHAGYGTIIRHAVRRSRRIIAVSEYTKQDIIDHFNADPQKIAVTYEAVDPPAQDNHQMVNVLGRYHIQKPFLLYVGNVYPHKNIEGLLKAFQGVVTHHPDLQLVIVGKDDYFFTRVKQLVKNSSIAHRVVFPGFVSDEDLPCLYRAARLYVFPSFCEGFGLPALEACSYGLPVVASNSSSLPEILGPAALYFNPHDIAEMREKIETALTNPKLTERLVQEGYRRLQRFDWGTMARQTLDLYSQICSNE